MSQRVVERFGEDFGEPPAVLVRAPGRVNLIGEHTDYNDGFVLPLAIDRAAWIALSPRADSEVHVSSIEFGDAANFTLGRLERGGPAWVEYLKGTAWALENAGHRLTGWEGVISSDVPIGAGLSSSAAVELATARAFAAVSGIEWEPGAMALLAQKAENEWVGMNCGIMDQMISAVGLEGHAVLIDCRTLATRAVPVPESMVVIIMDTATRRGLVDSAYNERRAQCEAAAEFFGVPALRDVTIEMFEARSHELDPTTARRARHIITENARTLAAADAMARGEGEKLGALMDESHESLRDDFEVSSPALDTIVEIAQAEPGCYGARMTGAGFGGCAVALVDRNQSSVFVANIAADYEHRTALVPQIYVCEASAGAAVMPLDA
jgi:galactokinase